MLQGITVAMGRGGWHELSLKAVASSVVGWRMGPRSTPGRKNAVGVTEAEAVARSRLDLDTSYG